MVECFNPVKDVLKECWKKEPREVCENKEIAARIGENVSREFMELDINGDGVSYIIPFTLGYRGGSFYIKDLDYKNIVKKLIEDEKRFYLLSKLNDELPLKNKDDFIFALELKNSNLQQVNFSKKNNPNKISIDNDILTLKDDVTIARLKGTQDFAALVAIKLKDANGSIDYRPLRDYMESSDSRSYSKFFTSVKDYIYLLKQPDKKDKKDSLPFNLLVSGAPGTGKSYYLDKKVKEALGITGETEYGLVGKDREQLTDEEKKSLDKLGKAKEINEYSRRVTFYEDYTYEDFVGCYKPVPDKRTAKIKYGDKEGAVEEEKITYEFRPGPFIDMYKRARTRKDKSFFLIIEEINRARAASVFGDIFQLLDRDDNGNSIYTITPNPDLGKYLEKELCDDYDGTMSLPDNLYIWATMNSADQGVFPLDSAFKRRWSCMYKDLYGSDGDTTPGNSTISCFIDGFADPKDIGWNEFRKKINDKILSVGYDEDKCLGMWYFNARELDQIRKYSEAVKKKEKNLSDMPDPFVDKLMYYLRQDVFRLDPLSMFKNPDSDNNDNTAPTMSQIRGYVKSGTPLNRWFKAAVTKEELEKWETERTEKEGQEQQEEPARTDTGTPQASEVTGNG